jgi:hypothetical protein
MSGTGAATGRSVYEMLGNRFTRLLMWMGLAAVATYLFDPERGEKRRKDLRKQVSQMRKKGEDMSKKAAKLAD